MLEKCSTAQSFIRTEMTTYRIGTLVIEIFFTLHRYCTVTVQYWCSVSKAKHDQVFSAALLNGHKIQISLQLPDCDLTWRVVWPIDVTCIKP